ncbi:MAG: PleD family two-component system response regulator [Candidatus Hermodarchaeota archaeon]
MQITNRPRNDTNARIPLILAIDDERDCADLIELILTKQHYLVEKVYNAQEALDYLSESKVLPDLILLDIKMPGKDGFTLCHELKKDPKYHDIPIIILSALTFPEDIEKGLACGVKDYILKPWSNEDLIRRINKHLPPRKAYAPS